MVPPPRLEPGPTARRPLAQLFDGPVSGLLGALAAVVGAGAAASSLATAQPVHLAPETWYLALVGTLLLGCVALLAPPPRREVRAAAVLFTAALWLVPVGPQRGAVIMALLLVALALALGRRLAAPTPVLPLGAAIAGALAAQIFFRAEALLPAALDPLAALRLSLPVAAAGGALWWLGRREPRTALLAGAVAVLAAGGVSASVAGSLVAVAATRELALQGAPGWRSPRGILALAALLVVVVWSPRLGAMGAAGAALFTFPAGPALAAVGLALTAALAFPASGAEAGRALWIALLLLPTALLPRALPARLLAGGALLVVAGTLLLPGRVGLALPLALLALALPARTTATRIQGSWLALVLVATLLVAGYPWLQADPLVGALELLGAPLAAVAAVLAAAIWGLALAARRFPRAALAGAAVGVVLLGIRVAAPHGGEGVELLGGTPITLDAEHAVWEQELELGAPVACVLVDSSLSNAITLGPGTVVATLSIEGLEVTERWELRAGEGTGEWAARREGPPRVISAGPAAWLTWVAPPGRHFGQWYRARWELPVPHPGAARVRLERAPGLPDDVTVSLSRLEVRP